MKNLHFWVLKFQENTGIELAACQIIRHSILLIGYIRYPVVAVHIVDAEEVEAVYAQRYVLQEGLLLVTAVVEQLITHADVGTAIGGSTETVGLQLLVRGCERQTVGKGKLQGCSCR